MNKKILFFLSVILFVSCSDEQDILNDNVKDVEVVSFYENSTRSSNSPNELNNKILKFKDQATFDRFVQNLNEMDEDQKLDWFKNIGFDGAYTELSKADKELDAIFDIEDDNDFLEAVNKFRKKYADKFVFNNTDKYDLSPYLPFDDEDLEIVGNINGIVKIGDKILQPKNKTPRYYDFLENKTSNNAPFEPAFGGYRESALMIKEGKYQSTVCIGADRNSDLLMIRFASQKKKKLWKRRHQCDYTLGLTIGGCVWNPLYQKNEKRGVIIKFLLPLLKTYQFNGVTNCYYRNFHSGACPNAHGNKDFKLNLKPRF